MSVALDRELAAELERWRRRGLARRTEDGEPDRLDFCSNDTLGLARHPDLVEAASRALHEHGTGAGAARLLGGGRALHAAVERAVAEWLSAEASLLFPSGYQANLGAVTALAGRGDAIVSDRLVHASLIDAARLSRARVLVHEHGDLDAVERRLRESRGARRRLVLTEGIFSMDGDAAPLAELDALCRRHDAWLLVDEAHAVGLVGPEGAGAWARVAAETGLARDPESRLAARVVTGGKALGVAGGLVVGSSALREQLVNHARAFVFTTAPPPALAAALIRAVELVRGAEDVRAEVLRRARRLAVGVGAPQPAAAIVPAVVGDTERCRELAAALAERGFGVRAVRPPTVPEGTSRMRLVVHAHNSDEDVEALVAAWEGSCPTPPAPPDAGVTAAATAPACFVVGTDTGIGKTVVAALLVRALARRGPARYWKPVQTGEDSDTRAVHELAGLAGGPEPRWSFPLPASPHTAAAAAGARIDPASLDVALAELCADADGGPLVVELAGGLLVPYDDVQTQADWLAREGLPVVLVARSGLGTLNHTLLTVEALRARSLEPRALFLVGEPHAANRETLERRAGIPRVFELPVLEPLDPTMLDRWIDRHDPAAVVDR